MEITCKNLGGKEILIEAIRELAQIYRFDEFRVFMVQDGGCVKFDVPSTEWLEHFTKVLKSESRYELQQTLRGSGYPFNMLKADNRVLLFVNKTEKGIPTEIVLTLDEARLLHRAVLDAVLVPFAEQGGDISSLRDLETFSLLGPSAEKTPD